jgi:hypothetical protein
MGARLPHSRKDEGGGAEGGVQFLTASMRVEKGEGPRHRGI